MKTLWLLLAGSTAVRSYVLPASPPNPTASTTDGPTLAEITPGPSIEDLRKRFSIDITIGSGVFSTLIQDISILNGLSSFNLATFISTPPPVTYYSSYVIVDTFFTSYTYPSVTSGTPYFYTYPAPSSEPYISYLPAPSFESTTVVIVTSEPTSAPSTDTPTSQPSPTDNTTGARTTVAPVTTEKPTVIHTTIAHTITSVIGSSTQVIVTGIASDLTTRVLATFIPSIASSSPTSSSTASASGLSTTAKIGIGVGAPVGALSAAALIFLFFSLHKQRKDVRSKGVDPDAFDPANGIGGGHNHEPTLPFIGGLAAQQQPSNIPEVSQRPIVPPGPQQQPIAYNLAPNGNGGGGVNGLGGAAAASAMGLSSVSSTTPGNTRDRTPAPYHHPSQISSLSGNGGYQGQQQGTELPTNANVNELDSPRNYRVSPVSWDGTTAAGTAVGVGGAGYASRHSSRNQGRSSEHMNEWSPGDDGGVQGQTFEVQGSEGRYYSELPGGAQAYGAPQGQGYQWQGQRPGAYEGT